MKIVVLGCGPKALSIYAKNRGLEQAGFKVPEIVILEQFEVAAHWQGGDYGFTDGAQPLGTPPEKDIGYPYNSEYKQYGAPDIDAFLFQYSWPAYKIAQQSYADWMDRDRPAPYHREWAKYLGWVSDNLQLKNSPNYIKGSLQKITKRDNRWVIQYASGDSQDAELSEIVCDSLALTGPGEPKRVPVQASHRSRIMNGRTFWSEENINLFRGWANQEKKIAVIGAGETTASVVSALLNINNAPNWKIDVISRRGTLYSRGEGYHENRYFSDPAGWGKLSEKLRLELIERTDRGVLSVRAMRAISASNIVTCKHGNVASIIVPGEASSTMLGPMVNVRLENESAPEKYDCVIVALGFNALSFGEHFKENLEHLEPLVSEENRPLLRFMVSNVTSHPDYGKLLTECAQKISDDLSVAGLEPKLYLPMLAGLTQGPGFPNLSCLGLLSDRILRHSIATLNPEKMRR